MRDYDLVVIGGGAGGLVAAREARRRHARVVILQDGPLGGDCTFTGCIPSKALLSAAGRGMSFTVAFGLSVMSPVDFNSPTLLDAWAGSLLVTPCRKEPGYISSVLTPGQYRGRRSPLLRSAVSALPKWKQLNNTPRLTSNGFTVLP